MAGMKWEWGIVLSKLDHEMDKQTHQESGACLQPRLSFLPSRIGIQIMFNLFPFFFSVKCESLLDVENQVIAAKEEIKLKLFIDKAISSFTGCFFKDNL